MPRSIVPLAPAVLAASFLVVACGDARTVSGEQGRCSSCHGDAATTSALSGAHAAHLAPDGVAGEISCGECHVVPATIEAGGHMDGHVDVVFGRLAGGAAARFDRQSGTCAVYCHGVTLVGGPAASPSWKADVHLGCGSCHGAPPAPPHAASVVCASCHPATVTAGGTIVAGGSHVNGKVDATAQACGSCHGIPPSSGRHGLHAQEGIFCGTCHPGASPSSGGPGHMNGTVDVAAPGWDPSRVSCANACHGGEEESWY